MQNAVLWLLVPRRYLIEKCQNGMTLIAKRSLQGPRTIPVRALRALRALLVFL